MRCMTLALVTSLLAVLVAGIPQQTRYVNSTTSATQASVTTASPAICHLDCHKPCESQYVDFIYWSQSSFGLIVTAATVSVIVNNRTNSTRTTTIYNTAASTALNQTITIDGETGPAWEVYLSKEVQTPNLTDSGGTQITTYRETDYFANTVSIVTIKFHTDVTFPLDEITWTGTIPTTISGTPTCTKHLNGTSIQPLPSLRPPTVSTQSVKSGGAYLGLDQDPLGYLWVPKRGIVPYNQNWLAPFYTDIAALQNGTCPFPYCPPVPSVPADGSSGAALFLTVTSTGTENGGEPASAVPSATSQPESPPPQSQPADPTPIFTPAPSPAPTPSSAPIPPTPTNTVPLSTNPAVQSQIEGSSPNSPPSNPGSASQALQPSSAQGIVSGPPGPGAGISSIIASDSSNPPAGNPPISHGASLSPRPSPGSSTAAQSGPAGPLLSVIGANSPQPNSQPSAGLQPSAGSPGIDSAPAANPSVGGSPPESASSAPTAIPSAGRPSGSRVPGASANSVPAANPSIGGPSIGGGSPGSTNAAPAATPSASGNPPGSVNAVPGASSSLGGSSAGEVSPGGANSAPAANPTASGNTPGSVNSIPGANPSSGKSSPGNAESAPGSNAAPASNSAISKNSPTIGQNPSLAAAGSQGPPTLTIGGQTLTPVITGSSTRYVAGQGGSTLSPGGPAVTISGNTVSLPSSDSAVVINGQTSPFPAGLFSSALALTLNGHTYSPATISGTPVYSIAPGQTVIAGGSPLTISGSTISVASSGSAVVVNGKTIPLAGPSQIPAPPLTLNGQTLTPTIISGTPEYSIAPSETLVPGSAPITISGSTISLASSGSAVVVNGKTTPISGPSITPAPALTLNGQTFTPTTVSGTPEYSIAPGETLSPGGPAATINGTTVSFAPSGSAVVINGQTSSLSPASTDVGNYIASGVGVTGTSAPQGFKGDASGMSGKHEWCLFTLVSILALLV